MKLYNTKDNPEFVKHVNAYCKYYMEAFDDYSGFRYGNMLSEMDTQPIYFAYDETKNRIACILTTYQRFGQTIWSADRNDLDAAAALRDAHSNTFFISVDSWIFHKSGLHATECCASYDKNTIYPSIANAGIWTNNPERVTALRDWLEEKYLKSADDWRNHIEYKWIHAQKFTDVLYDKELMDYPWKRDDYGHYAHIGFHYMNWDRDPENAWYLLAVVGNTPIGCICIQKFEQYGYYGLSYIDVAFPYKNNGVAKKMIHKLTKFMPSDMPLLLSTESEEGKKCHMHECFKRETWPNALVTQEEFDEMCRKKRALGV